MKLTHLSTLLLLLIRCDQCVLLVYILGHLDACLLPRAEGPCSERQARWYFDQNERRCAPFYYGGCHGNANNFESSDDCQQACRALALSAGRVCRLPFPASSSDGIDN